jgi:hypothetical protein
MTLLRFSCLTLALLASLGGAALAKPQIAILGLEVIDKSGAPTPADAQVAEQLTKELRARAKTGGPYALAANSDRELIDLKLIENCDDEKPVCMQAIGAKDLHADVLLYGHIEKQNNAYAVTLFLFDVARRTREKTYPETIQVAQASGPALAAEARKIYSKLTGATEGCTIVVQTAPSVDGATVTLNGSPKGTTASGSAMLSGLNEGRYKVGVDAKDYKHWDSPSDVSCVATATATVQAQLTPETTTVATNPVGSTNLENPNETGPTTGPAGPQQQTGSVSNPESHGPPWKYVAIGTGVVGVAGLAVGIFASSELEKTNQGSDCTFTVNADGSKTYMGDATHQNLNGTCSHGNLYKTLQYPMYIAGGVLAGVAVFAIYEAVRGHHNSNEHMARGHHKTHEPFVIAPVATPDGGGVTFSMTW